MSWQTRCARHFPIFSWVPQKAILSRNSSPIGRTRKICGFSDWLREQKDGLFENWYTSDGYSGGSYTNCSDTAQPGVAPIVNYLNALEVPPNCAHNAYYLLNNYVPAFIGSGQTDPINNGPFTLPPVIKQRHIGDQLSRANVSWAYFGERWNDFKTAPGLGTNFGSLDPVAYLYCSICNPFLYSASIMTDPKAIEAHLKDTLDLYDAIADGTLPAVSFVKPSTFNDGHPASSRVDLFESFTKRIIEEVQSNRELWESTAIVVTVDEGGGYYDSGYVQPVDYFGDGTRIPLLVVSKYSEGGHVSHEYSDHASIVKFIERNWKLPKLSDRTRDNLPNPKTSDDNPYVPLNSPAIGDLFGNFSFADDDADWACAGAGARQAAATPAATSKRILPGGRRHE